MNSPSSFSNNVYLTQLFEKFKDEELTVTFLSSAGYAAEQSLVSDTFVTDFVLLVRLQHCCPQIIKVLMGELLKTYLSPHEIFRSDHLYIRILKEFVIQSLGTTLLDFLGDALSRLGRPLTSLEIAECATQLFKKLHLFRFPCETKAVFLTIATSIAAKFPGHEWKGLSGIFFLRYLCPLIMNSPSAFDIEPSEEYSRNSIQLAKLIQNLANGCPVPPKPEFLLVSMENQSLMEEFLQRLVCASEPLGVGGSNAFFSNLALISSPSNQVIHRFIDQAVESLYLYHEHHQLLLCDKWVSFAVCWRRFASELDDSILRPASLSSSSSVVLESSAGPSIRTKRRHWAASLLRRSLRSASSEDNTPPPAPAIHQRRFSGSSLLSSPRSESNRLAMRLQINALKNLLDLEDEAIRKNTPLIIELLAKIAELFAELVNVPEFQNHQYPIRTILLEYAKLVESFIATLHSDAAIATHAIHVTKFLVLLEDQYLSRASSSQLV